MEHKYVEDAFDSLSGPAKVALLASLYWGLSAAEEDRFLEETENA